MGIAFLAQTTIPGNLIVTLVPSPDLLILILITILSMLYHTYQTSRKKPAESLRYE